MAAGREVSFAEFFAISHRHPDGTAVNEATEEEIVRFYLLLYI